MQLNIVKLTRKMRTTKYGDKISVGLITKEYGDKKWINGWEDDINSNWVEGQTVEATVEQNGDYLNFKAIRPSVSPQAVKSAPVGQKNGEPNWDKISFGKCKYGFLIELIKLGKSLQDAEIIAEQWATASMRKLGTPEFKDYGNGEELDQVPF